MEQPPALLSSVRTIDQKPESSHIIEYVTMFLVDISWPEDVRLRPHPLAHSIVTHGLHAEVFQTSISN